MPAPGTSAHQSSWLLRCAGGEPTPNSGCPFRCPSRAHLAPWEPSGRARLRRCWLGPSWARCRRSNHSLSSSCRTSPSSVPWGPRGTVAAQSRTARPGLGCPPLTLGVGRAGAEAGLGLALGHPLPPSEAHILVWERTDHQDTVSCTTMLYGTVVLYVRDSKQPDALDECGLRTVRLAVKMGWKGQGS